MERRTTRSCWSRSPNGRLFAVESARAAAALRESRDVLALAMRRRPRWARGRAIVATGTVWWSPELEEIVGLPPGGFDGSEDGSTTSSTPRIGRPLAQAVEAALPVAGRLPGRVPLPACLGRMAMDGRPRQGRSTAPTAAPRMLYGLGIDITERRRAVEALQDRPIAARTSSSPPSRTSCATRWRRSPRACTFCAPRPARANGGPQGARDHRTPGRRRWCGWSTTCSTWPASRPARPSCAASRWTWPMPCATRSRPAARWSSAAAHTGSNSTCRREPVFVNADRTRLAQVFANLLNNSAKYSAHQQPICHHGRPRRARRRRARARRRHRHPPEQLPRHLRDVPPGRPHRRPLAGRPRASACSWSSASSRCTAAVSSAQRRARPRQRIRRPASRRSPTWRPAARRAADGQAAVPRSRRRILVVDDNADAAAMLATVLTIDGHETRIAHDGVEAMRAAADYRPDVIFLDIGMPLLDGHGDREVDPRAALGQGLVLVALDRLGPGRGPPPV